MCKPNNVIYKLGDIIYLSKRFIMKKNLKKYSILFIVIVMISFIVLFDSKYANTKKNNVGKVDNVIDAVEKVINDDDKNDEKKTLNEEEKQDDDKTLDDKVVEKEENIKTDDKKENVKKDNKSSNTNKVDNPEVKPEKPKKDNVSSSDDKNNQEDKKEENSGSDNVIKEENKSEVKTLDVINNEYRNEIKSKYGVLVGYKDEMDDIYKNAYFEPVRQYNDEKINKILISLDTELKKYPSSFFSEIKNKWKNLTIYLVEKVGPSVAGLTDNKDSNTVVILISTEGYLFESTLHHEIMHYIDCYLADKIGAEAIEASMNELNPEGFTYGNKTNEYVYYYSNPAYFLSAYSKSDYKEDRAVLFSDMIFRTLKKDYYTKGNPINEKAKVISNQLEKYFDCVSSSTTETWERFIEY